MPLHLLKLCVGVPDLDHMLNWITQVKAGRDTADHTTRMFPKRREEILNGGSLYWVIRGMVQCRQPIAGLVAVTGDDGIGRCRIDFEPVIVPVRPVPRRAFQGWRYLDAADAPPDLKPGQRLDTLPEKMRRELMELGLL